ncbi:NERD domain-containing protein [Lentibacillus sediminis]|uniref:NERD domain-containing protein n=1 Tax=Lentibacillus sediminis TaxID=1940529 RepID=UPI0019568C05|nr:NERD domain-containing protein [Lentibacillus sediminis]
MKGEKEVAYSLRFLDEDNYYILRDIRLRDEQGFFQIDTLVLSETFALILEVKNWYGTIVFGENGQVTRINDNQEETGFKNPVPQAKLQQHRLQKWLHSHGITNLPIEFLVVISFPSTILKAASTKNLIPANVIHNSDLFFRISEIANNFSSSSLNKLKLRDLSRAIAGAHMPKNDNVLQRFQLTSGDLLEGVFCPECGASPMRRNKRQWACGHCGCNSKDAHLAALNDYKLLIGHSISNREARRFLQVESPYVAKYILQKEGYGRVGMTKNRRYLLR